MADGDPAAMDDSGFRELLGVPAGAGRQEIRRAYRQMVMENHPDRFPAERKQAQELAMIALGEAYAALMRGFRGDGAPARGDRTTAPFGRPTAPFGRPTAPFGRPTAPPEQARPAPVPPRARSRAVGPHGDPAYAYYKQGFVNFSIAVRGIAELTSAAQARQLPSWFPRYRASQDIASSLALLEAAQGYFARVVERYPGSVWCADARTKLARVRRFTRLYRTILSNMGEA